MAAVKLGGGAAHRVVLATGNSHKVSEVGHILTTVCPRFDPAQLVAVTELAETFDPLEDGADFGANALLKARAAVAATGLPAIADDSGICVDIMGGAPGIFSARWCGRHGDDSANLELLLAQLADTRPDQRGARFVCAAALVTPTGEELTCRGEMRGQLAYTPTGGNGFGYDPIFIPTGYRQSAAELDPQVKNAISHRFHAFSTLAQSELFTTVCGI